MVLFCIDRHLSRLYDGNNSSPHTHARWDCCECWYIPHQYRRRPGNPWGDGNRDTGHRGQNSHSWSCCWGNSRIWRGHTHPKWRNIYYGLMIHNCCNRFIFCHHHTRGQNRQSWRCHTKRTGYGRIKGHKLGHTKPSIVSLYYITFRIDNRCLVFSMDYVSRNDLEVFIGIFSSSPPTLFRWL